MFAEGRIMGRMGTIGIMGIVGRMGCLQKCGRKPGRVDTAWLCAHMRKVFCIGMLEVDVEAQAKHVVVARVVGVVVDALRHGFARLLVLVERVEVGRIEVHALA